MATGNAIDEGKLLARYLKRLLNIDIELSIAVDSEIRFDSLTTCHHPIDKSIRGDVGIIRYEFRTQLISTQEQNKNSTF